MTPTPDRIMQMAWGYAPPIILETALRHRVFDYIDEAPRTLEEIAQYAGGSTRGWRALLDALVGLAFLSKDQSRYRTTPESSAFLVTTKPSFAGGLLKHMTQHLIPKWLQMDEIVTTGKPGRAVNDAQQGPEFFAAFVEDIFPMSYPSAQALGAHLRVDQLTHPFRVIDLAAGSGVWGIALAQQSPHVHVTAVDWPAVLEVTQRVSSKHGVADRFTYVAGDILETAFPENQDLATLGHIVHSEGETRSRKLFAKLHRTLKPGGTIAIGEWLPNAERTGPAHTLIFGVNMLVNTEQGDVYSFEEISSWLADAGFTNARLLDAPGPSPLILAERAA